VIKMNEWFDGTAARKLEKELYSDNFPEGSKVYGYLNQGKEKTRNPYKRWARKVGKVWKNYTDFGNPLEMWKPILAGFGAKILRSIETVPEERRSFFDDIVGGTITILRTGWEQYSHNAPYDIMPALRRHLSAAEGVSNLKYIYAYYKPGDRREYTIYLSGGEIPNNEVLRNNIRYVDDNNMSPYEGDPETKETISRYFDTQDGPPVLNAATMFDYADYFGEEPEKAHRWSVKEDSWIANQYGNRNSAMEAALPEDLQGKVKIYERPVETSGFWYSIGRLLGDESPRSGRMWIEWAVKKPIIYAFGDLLFEPLEVTLELIVPPATLRDLVYQKAKSISAAWRGISNPRPHYLYYGQAT
jgi:hypothetical protein